MKSRSMCVSLNRKTADLPERIEEYADIYSTSKAGALYFIVNDWERLKFKERIRELEASR